MHQVAPLQEAKGPLPTWPVPVIPCTSRCLLHVEVTVLLTKPGKGSQGDSRRRANNARHAHSILCCSASINQDMGFRWEEVV